MRKDKSISPMPQKPTVIPRRLFLPWFISGVGFTGLSIALIRPVKTVQLAPFPEYAPKNHPRFAKLRKGLASALQLEPGFYLNPKSQIIHYLPEGQSFHSTGLIKAARLQPKDPTKVAIALPNPATRKPVGQPRVNRARASYSFERAAIAELKQNHIDRGCDLLIYAIQYELGYRAARPFRMFQTAPSFRLYDLLAGVSVRFNKMEYLTRLISLTESVKAPTAIKGFAQRLTKWRDPQSHWYRRWTDKSKRIEWKVDQSSGLVF